MAVNRVANISYGLDAPLIVGAPTPILSNRAPTANDRAEIGSTWINQTTNTAYTLTSIAANASTWTTSGGGGGAGDFASLVVTPGPIALTGTTTINTAGASATSIGVGGTGAVNIGNTTGNTQVTGSLTTSTTLNATTTVNGGTGVVATTGNVTALTGNITATLGNISANAGQIISSTGISFTGAGAAVVFVAGPEILAGAGAPAGAAPKGSLYLRSDGTGVNNRAYIATDAVGTWTAIVTVA